MYCPNCGKESIDQAAFCGHCGAALRDPAGAEKTGTECPASAPPKAAGGAASRDETVWEGERPLERSAPTAASDFDERGAPPTGKPEKRRSGAGLGLFLLCCLLAAAAGGAMGFLTAQGALGWTGALPLEQIPWLFP